MDQTRVNEPLYVCVHVPEFPAQALLRLRPELARTPVAVLAGDPPLEQVVSVNAAAASLGVARGLTKAELDSFDGVTRLRRSEAEERGARAALLEAAGAFTPRIELQPGVASALVLVLDMAGTTRIFGKTEKMLERLAKTLGGLRLYVHLAASANLHTAVALAGYARKQPWLVAAGDEAEALRGLPLAALNLTPAQAETLSLWGLHTLGELAALPEVELVVRLGQAGKRLRLLARGEQPHLMVPEEPVFTLEELVAFDAPLDLLDSLLFVLGPMLDQLIARARNRALALASVTLTLGLDDQTEHRRVIRPALPVLDREALLKLLHLDLLAHPPRAGIVRVHLAAEPGVRGKVQAGLFAPQLPEAMRLDVTLARIAALVGEERVGRAKLLDTHQPDSFRMERFLITAGTPTPAQPRAAMALRRVRPAASLVVWQVAARLHSFTWAGRRYTVEEVYGPWRRSGSWWTPEVWSSEEWDVRASSAEGETLLCVMRNDLLRRDWRLEALYD